MAPAGNKLGARKIEALAENVPVQLHSKWEGEWRFQVVAIKELCAAYGQGGLRATAGDAPFLRAFCLVRRSGIITSMARISRPASRRPAPARDGHVC
jgi:hypothetical protein